MDKKLKEIEEIKDPFFSKATLIVGRGEDDAWLIDKKDFNDYTTALQSYMRLEVLKGRIESSEKMLELWTINGCPTASGCKYINELQQLKSK